MPTVEEALVGYLKSSVSADIEIRQDLRLIEDLNLDSLDVVELTMHLEDAIGITVDDDADIRSSETVGDLVKRIRETYGVE